MYFIYAWELLISLPAIHYDCFSLSLLLLLFLSFTSDALVSKSQGNGVSNHSVKREQAGREASGVGKREPMKSAKKPGMYSLHFSFVWKFLFSCEVLICNHVYPQTKQKLQKRRHVSCYLGRRHLYVRECEKYKKISL